MAMWVCPKCKGENLDYGKIELEWEACYFPWECPDCWLEWEEWYSMDYDWQYNLYDKDWNEYLPGSKDEDD